MKLLGLFATVSLTLATLGCGAVMEPSSTASPVPGDAQAGSPTPTVTPAVGLRLTTIERVPVRWVPAGKLLDMDAAKEDKDPFAEFRKESGGTPPYDFGVYVGDVSGTSREFYTSRRYLGGHFGLDWDASGIKVAFGTMLKVPVLGIPHDFKWEGALSVDPRTGRATEKLAAQPSPHWNSIRDDKLGYEMTWIAGYRDVRAQVWPARGAQPIAGFAPGSYLQGPDGVGRRLEGMNAYSMAATQLAANGKVLVGWSVFYQPGGTPSEIYIVPMVDGDALVVRDAVSRVVGPSGISFVFRTANGTELAEFDPTTFTVVRSGTAIPPTPHVAATRIAGIMSQPVQIPSPAPTATPTPATTTPSRQNEVASPGGRYLAYEEPYPGAPGDGFACKVWPNRQLVEDTRTGEKYVVAECGSIHLTWLDDRRAVVRKATNMHGQYPRYTYTDAVTRKTFDLFDKSGLFAEVTPSPDKQSILVSGGDLSVYSIAGERLARFEPPEGYVLYGAVWSPDGKQFAFVLGPEDPKAHPYGGL